MCIGRSNSWIYPLDGALLRVLGRHSSHYLPLLLCNRGRTVINRGSHLATTILSVVGRLCTTNYLWLAPPFYSAAVTISYGIVTIGYIPYLFLDEHFDLPAFSYFLTASH